jgi:general secretion pathway protein D
MLCFNRFLAIFMTGVMLGPMLPIEAKTRKGDKYLAEGRAHEDKKEWDAALEDYEKALSEDPGDLNYQMAAQKARFEDSSWHVSSGTRIRAQGQLGEALLEFQKGFALNPASTVAEQEILRTQLMIERERRRVEQTGAEAAPEVRGMTPAQVANKETEDRIDRLLPVPELRPLKPTLQDFKMNSQTPKVLFDTLALNAGINVLYDPEYLTSGPKEKQTVTFNNSTVQEALNYLALLTKSYWKPINANTIFVTMDNANKRRDYEDEVTRIFFLKNIQATQDLTAMITAIRTVADLQRLFPFEGQYAIIAKGTADKVALAEKIIHDLDKPKSEVVIDIFVMEASSVYMRSLAAGPFTTGVNLQGNFTPRQSIQVQQAATTATTSSTTTSTSTTGTTTGTTGTGTSSSTTGYAIPFSAIGQTNFNDWSTTLPSAVFQATLSDTRTKVLQSPQLRGVDGQKSTMKIGEKEPTASGSFANTTGAIGGAGISPLVNTQFTYLDVGVNVEIMPHVHENGDVSMHVSIDISSVTGQVNLGGINEPIIGQRKVDQEIRLREGEVSLIGGLLSTQDNTTKTGVPGLANIPILGKLFSGNSVDRERDEIMIALIPHVVRRPDITPENVRGIASGQQQVVSLRYSPAPVQENFQAPPPARENPAPAAAPAGDSAVAKPAGQPVAVPVPVVTQPAPAPAAPPPAMAPPPAAVIQPPPVPASAPPGALPPATAPPEVPAAAQQPAPGAPAIPATPAAPTTKPAAGGPPKIRFVEESLDKNAGDSFSVSVSVDNAKDVVSAPFIFQYDPKLLSLDNVVAGKFWSADGEEPLLIKNVQNESGMATVRVRRKPGSAAVSGSGTMLTLTFKALAGGTATLTAANVTLNNAQDQMLGSGSPTMTVKIK